MGFFPYYNLQDRFSEGKKLVDKLKEEISIYDN